MKKNIKIPINNYHIDLITNEANSFNKIVLCLHGFGGDKWGDAYSGLKQKLSNSLVVSFDSCGHGDSEISSENMRLSLAVQEIESVVNFLKQTEPNKSIILVAVSYGAYRAMLCLGKCNPNIQKVIYINPAFRMLDIMEKIKDFKYSQLKENEKVPMKRSLNKFISKAFLDDLFENNLYTTTYNLKYDTEIIVGTRDSLIPIEDTLEIAKKYNYKISYIDEEHCFENKDSWNVVADIIEG